MSFGKIFESTFSGSMVGSGPSVFAVWAYVIAKTKPPGVVEINPALVAAAIGDTLENVKKAIEVLTSPDVDSTTKTHEGRRLIQEGPFLYSVTTWQKYRDLRNDAERRAYNAEAQRRSRAGKVENTSFNPSMTVNDSQDLSAQAEDRRQKQKTEATIHSRASALEETEEFQQFWKRHPRKIGKPNAIRAWHKQKCEEISEEVINALLKWNDSPDWTKDNGQFIPHPATWLNRRGWEDELATPRRESWQ